MLFYYFLFLHLETAMGTHLKSSETSTYLKYEKAVDDFGKITSYRLVRLWLHIYLLFQFMKLGRQYKVLLATLHQFSLNIIRKRRQVMWADITSTPIISNIENDAHMENSKRKLVMLDLLLYAESEGKIDEQGIREEVDTFMFAVSFLFI